MLSTRSCGALINNNLKTMSNMKIDKIKKLFTIPFIRGLLIIIAFLIIMGLVSNVFSLLVYFIVYIWWFIKWPLGILVCLLIILFTDIVFEKD